MEVEHDPPAAMPNMSHLGYKLLSEWAWGHNSAKQVQQYADAACKDGLPHPAVKKLAGLGSEGRNPHNCHKELLNFMKP